MTASSLTIRALGAHVRVAFGDAVPGDVVARARRAWSGASTASDREDRLVDVPTVLDADDFLQHLSTSVTLEALSHGRGRLMMLHAAGVAMEDGRVLAFVGPSGRGKTTLSRALAQRFGYVSDETIAFDRDLNVLPYRKPLSVVRDGRPKDQVAPEDAGLRELPDVPLRLAGIVLLDRDASAESVTVEHLPFAVAAPELVTQTSYLMELPGTVRTLAELCERAGGVRRLRYAEATDVPDMIDELLVADPEPETWAALTLRVRDAVGSVVPADAVDYGDVLVTLSERTLRVLDGIAPTILRHAQRSEEDITAAVVDRFGAPPHGDATAIVRGAIDELREAGFVIGGAHGE
ncbi:hypothetical protein [Microbacterium sp.]|uniref:hypothetical protein n=1 Tax=Microbacterium sp. TaxID=51671 RepID=UPI0028125DA2|nr:hypothetical protein [Microbacterium sp.]